jgi:hypothetical protein
MAATFGRIGVRARSGVTDLTVTYIDGGMLPAVWTIQSLPSTFPIAISP